MTLYFWYFRKRKFRANNVVLPVLHTEVTTSSYVCASSLIHFYGPLVGYANLRVAHATGMFSPPPRVSDPDMQHGTCVTQVPGCMSGSPIRGSLKSVAGNMFPAFPVHAQPTILRIWKEAHANKDVVWVVSMELPLEQQVPKWLPLVGPCVHLSVSFPVTCLIYLVFYWVNWSMYIPSFCFFCFSISW